MYIRHGFFVIVLAALGWLCVSTPVSAASEKYSLNSNSSSLTISGGNVNTWVTASARPLVLTADKSRSGVTPYTGEFQSAKDDVCYKKTVAMTVNVKGTSVISIEMYCPAGGETPGWEGWSGANGGASVTKEGGSNGGGSSGSNTGGATKKKPSTSSGETYEFVTDTGSQIKACKGMFAQFAEKDGCVVFNTTQAPERGAMMPDDLVYTVKASAYFTDDPCTVTFVIGLPKDRTKEGDKLVGKLNYIKFNDDKGCSQNGGVDLKGLTAVVGTNKSIRIGGLDKLKDLLGGKIEGDGDAESEPTCGTVVTGIGWILCPITNAGVMFADTIWGLFEGLLKTNPLKQSGGSDDGAYYATWQSIRNVANVLFIIVFLLVVFSQISNIGIGNYGVKKMLPRMIMAAIAINLSFFIVQIAVDIANVLGSAILDTMTNMNENASFTPSLGGIVQEIVGLGTGVGVVFMGVSLAAGSGLAMPLLILLALLLIPAIVGLIAGFLTLVIRSALIPIIAIFAPLAFVAYIFPNGQSLFDKWRKTFTALLILYPLSAIYYGALKFTSLMLISTGGVMEKMVGHILLFAGCFVVLSIALKGNAITGKVFGSIQGGINKVVEPARKVGMGVAGGMAALRFAKFKNTNPSSINAGKAGFLGRHAVTRGVGRVLRTFDQSKWAREQGAAVAKGDQQQAFQEWATGDGKDKFTKISGIDAGSSLTGKAYMNTLTEKAVKNQEARISSMDISQLAKEFKEAVNANNGQGDEIRALAAQNRLLESGALGLTMANDVLASTNGGGQLYGSLASNVRSNHAGAMAQDNVTKAWAGKSNSEDQSWQAATARAQEKIVKDGITPEKFATLSDEAQARILSDSSTRARLSNEALKALGDSSSIFGGKVSDKNRDVINVELSARGVSVAGAAPAAGGSPASVPGGAGFNQQTQSGLWIPRNGSGGQAPPPPNNQPPAPPSTP